MRKISLLVGALVALLACHPGGTLTKPVTVDFTNYEADHMIVTFAGEQHQGTFTFVSDSASVQTQNMPAHGRYTVTLAINPDVISSCQVALDGGENSLVISEFQPGSVSLAAQRLGDLYTFSISCR